MIEGEGAAEVAQVCEQLAARVAEIYMAHDGYVGQERADKLIKALQEYEASWA